MIIKIVTISLMAVFYICYFAKLISQKKQGIKTDQLGKGKEGFVKFIEVALKIITYLLPVIQIISIVFYSGTAHIVLQFTGVVGVFERIEDGKLSVAKVTFGAEPKDYEVQEYIQKYYFSLKFSPAVDTVVKDIKRNPKRMQREAKKQMQETGIGTKSQQALKLQQEQNKQERKVRSREKKEADELRMFELKQQKKREKHRGH